MPHAQNFRPVSVTRRPQGAAAATICAGQQHNMQFFGFCTYVQNMLCHIVCCVIFCLPALLLMVLHGASFGLCIHACTQLAAMLQPRALASRQGEKMCVSSMWDHSPKALAADELCISYAYNCDPIPKMARIQIYWAFLRRGFVPFEYLPVCRS
jgi:hypothetical protein